MDNIALLQIVISILLVVLGAFFGLAYKNIIKTLDALSVRQDKMDEKTGELFTLKVVFEERDKTNTEKAVMDRNKISELENYNKEFVRLQLERLWKQNDEKDKEISALNAKALLLAASELAAKKAAN